MTEDSGLPRILIVSWLPLAPADSGYKSRVVHLADRLTGFCEVRVVSPGEEPENRSFSWRCVERGEGTVATRFLSRLPKGKVLSTFSPGLSESVSDCARDFRPQAVIAEGLWAAPAARNAAAATGAKYVVVVQNIESKSAQGVYPLPIRSLLARYEHHVYGKADLLISLSQEDEVDLKELMGRNPPPISFVPNGTDLPSPTPPEVLEELGRTWNVREDEKIVLFTGRLDYPPNRLALEWLSREVYPQLRDFSPPIRWMVVGAPIPESPHPPFEFMGYVENLNAAFGLADVCVSPVRHGSGTSIKVLDYLGAGKPIVSTKVGARGLPIRAGVHFLLADSPKKFSENVVELLEDPERASRMGAAGRDAVESHLTWERSAEDFAGRIAELIHS